jgi:hypothetical protein
MQTHLNIRSTPARVDWMDDRELEARDNAAIAEMDRRTAIEDSVTFAELLEEMADFTQVRAEEFMKSFRQYTRGMPTMYALVDQAFERIVERKLKGE